MNRSAADLPNDKIDFDRFRLRRFIENLGADELEVRDEPTQLSSVASIIDGNQRAVLFRSVEGAEIVGNVVGSRSRLARAFGVATDKLLFEVLRRLKSRPTVVEVETGDAPVHQVILSGEDADLTKLPVHLQHGMDGAPYISAGIDHTVDPSSGLTNVGVRRLMLRGRRECGIDLLSPSDLRANYERHVSSGKRLPIAFVIGAHPVDFTAAVMRLPIDELGIVASLRDAPLPTVKCVTNDVRVPADAEMVLEGYIDERGYVEEEGPFGEFLGYYGVLKRNPVFHLTAITKRHDALFQTATIGGRSISRTDTAQLCALRTEAMIWRALETAVREPTAVCATGASGGMFNVRVALRQRVPGEARNAIMACFGSLANIKNVFVVDPDIDIFSDEQIEWALATRFQPDRDIVVLSGLRTLPLDPSLAGAIVGSKAGFDLTWPFGQGGALNTQIPEPPAFAGRLFGSLRSALADGPKFFEELMTAVGSKDGREVVRALDEIRSVVSRDDWGRYRLASD